jgi:AmmeMemoRadiSam system protein B
MSLVFSAIVPHSPLLLPTIGKENLKRLENTSRAYEKLAASLEASNVETIVIISPHGVIQPGSFTMNLNPNFTASFEEFGDFATKAAWAGDLGLAYKIRERLETRAPLQLVSEEKLDHGTTIPLFLLTKKLPTVKIIPLYFSDLSNEEHFKFGQLLNREIIYNKEKIAVIASGDLSHRLGKDSPGGYLPKAKKFDKKVIDYLKQNKNQDLINLDQKEIIEASECGLRSILILAGIMDKIKFQPQLLSYESPFGIGYLVMEFKL